MQQFPLKCGEKYNRESLNSYASAIWRLKAINQIGSDCSPIFIKIKIILYLFFLVTSVSQALCVWEQSCTPGISCCCLLGLPCLFQHPENWKLHFPDVLSVSLWYLAGHWWLLEETQFSKSTFWADKVKNIQQRMTWGSLSMTDPSSLFSWVFLYVTGQICLAHVFVCALFIS